MSLHKTIKSLFQSAVQGVVSRISDFATRPGKDFTRSRKFPADKLISFLVTQGASSTRVEMPDFFGMDDQMPTSSAFRQQQAKLSPEAIAEVFRTFSHSFFSLGTPKQHTTDGYRCIAVDGSTATFSRSSSFAPDEYFVSEGNMAHVIEKGQFFLFRSKDALSKGLIRNFNLPEEVNFRQDCHCHPCAQPFQKNPGP